MAKKVAEILDIDVPRVKNVTYLAVDKAKDKTNALSKTATGHMIFDFDPSGGSRGMPYAWRIIWQNSLIAGDQWKPSKPS